MNGRSRRCPASGSRRGERDRAAQRRARTSAADGRTVPTIHLPTAWTRHAFGLRVGERAIEVNVAREAIARELLAGDVLEVKLQGTPVQVRRGDRVRVPLLAEKGDAIRDKSDA